MLEHEIQKLTDAIDRLIVAIGAVATVATPAAPTQDASPATNDKLAPMTFVEEVDAGDALRARCMAMIKGDRGRKDAIKGLIASHSDGGVLISDIPITKYVEFSKALDVLDAR